MDARVPAAIALHLAKAELKVAELERLEAETPNLRSNSDQRLRIGRRLRVARELAESWRVVVSLVDRDKTASEFEEFVAKQSAPERVVGWTRYVENARDQVTCNRLSCKDAYPAVTGLKWLAIRDNGDVDTEHTQCDQCGKVLSA